MKYFRFSWDFVLWGISYVNLIMLQMTIPTYEEKRKDDKKEKENDQEEVTGSEETSLADIFNQE